MRILFLHPSKAAASLLQPIMPDVTVASRHPGGTWDALVRWGVIEGSDAPFTYNAAWALSHAADPLTRRTLLSLNGVPVRTRSHPRQRTANARIVAKYRVHMVDLYAVSIRRIRRDQETRVTPAPRTRILEALARRTLYALGLHFGSVDIVVDRTGAPFVSSVDPAPPASGELLAAYAHALAGALHTLTSDLVAPSEQRLAHVVLGADPEFIIVRRHNRKLRYASDVFPQHGSVGYDRQSITVGGRRRHPIAELRPEPTPSPYTLVVNLQRELRRAHRMAPDQNADWLAGAHPGPGCFTGGHVHFSGVRPTTFFLRALDNYVAIPALLIENADTARARRPRYGSLGEFREKDHGGFEYRTLNSWLTSMRRTRATLCLAKLVAVEYPRLLRHHLASPHDHLAFYQGNKDAFRESVEGLWDDMRGTYSYQQYSQDLEGTRIWILNRRQWRERVDLKRLWRIL